MQQANSRKNTEVNYTELCAHRYNDLNVLMLSAKMNSFTLTWKLHNISGSHKSKIASAKFGVDVTT